MTEKAQARLLCTMLRSDSEYIYGRRAVGESVGLSSVPKVVAWISYRRMGIQSHGLVSWWFARHIKKQIRDRLG